MLIAIALFSSDKAFAIGRSIKCCWSVFDVFCSAQKVYFWKILNMSPKKFKYVSKNYFGDKSEVIGEFGDKFEQHVLHRNWGIRTTCSASLGYCTSSNRQFPNPWKSSELCPHKLQHICKTAWNRLMLGICQFTGKHTLTPAHPPQSSESIFMRIWMPFQVQIIIIQV